MKIPAGHCVGCIRTMVLCHLNDQVYTIRTGMIYPSISIGFLELVFSANLYTKWLCQCTCTIPTADNNNSLKPYAKIHTSLPLPSRYVNECLHTTTTRYQVPYKSCNVLHTSSRSFNLALLAKHYIRIRHNCVLAVRVQSYICCPL